MQKQNVSILNKTFMCILIYIDVIQYAYLFFAYIHVIQYAYLFFAYIIIIDVIQYAYLFFCLY